MCGPSVAGQRVTGPRGVMPRQVVPDFETAFCPRAPSDLAMGCEQRCRAPPKDWGARRISLMGWSLSSRRGDGDRITDTHLHIDLSQCQGQDSGQARYDQGMEGNDKSTY